MTTSETINDNIRDHLSQVSDNFRPIVSLTKIFLLSTQHLTKMPGTPLLQRVSDGEVFVQHLTKHLTRHLTIGGRRSKNREEENPRNAQRRPGDFLFFAIMLA